MLIFKDKEEENFWKQVVIAAAPNWWRGVAEADWVVEKLRERQPVQQFPEIEK